MSSQLSFVSFNVRGLRDTKKRRTVFRHMHVKYPNHVVILQETHSTKDIERRWSTEWGGDIIFSHGIANARGTCIMIPKNFKGDVLESKGDEEGRIVSVLLKIEDLAVELVGIYAPTQGHYQQQITFYKELRQYIRSLGLVHPLILCGDFNVYMSALDTSQKLLKLSGASEALHELVEEFELRDVWRQANPDLRQYTWRKISLFQHSRIDLFLVSSSLIDSQQITKSEIDPGPRSDHSIIVLSLELFCSKRGPGVWKMNLSILENEDLVRNIKEEIQVAKNRQNQYSDAHDLGLLIEMLLSNIRVMCIKVSKRNARERRKKEIDLEARVQDLEKLLALQPSSAALKTEYQDQKEELDAFKSQAAERAMLWSRANWLEQGEKPTKYFLNLQKKRSADRAIHVLEGADGETITGVKNILDNCREFYESLHQSRGISEQLENFMQNAEIPKLSEEDKLSCEGPLTIQECKIAVADMSDNKSPSVSGFNKEFINYFWNDIGELIVAYANDAYEKGRLFITQRRGVLVLIPKSGNQKKLKNKRPICLLDIIYKIIAKVLAKRLGNVVKEVVHSDQSGFIKGRNIQDNLRIIQDVIDYTQIDDISGLLVALDFKAAFNSIEHHFIWYALRCFGFGDSFTRWIQLLYNGSMLTVLNNGYTSEWFQPKRGIMQGCPISGMLFNLAVELLAIKMRQTVNIRGITINDTEVKVSQYADDATVFVSDSESVQELVKQLRQFGEVSGLELNVNKSKILWLGKDRNKRESVCGIPAAGKVKILGMWFSSTECCVDQNLGTKISEIRGTLDRWSQRDLSLKGRITVCKSLIISKLVYILSCAMIPDVRLKSIQSLIMRYVWRGRPPKVKAKVLCQRIADGGLSAVDTRATYTSLKLSWIRRLLNGNTSWIRVFQARCYPYAIKDLLMSRITREGMTRFRLSEFYVDLLLEYRKLNRLPVPSTAAQMSKELVWFNPEITINGKSFFEKEMYSSGIKYVGDVVDCRGRMLSYDRFRRKYPMCNVGFLKYCGIISSIPRVWKEAMRNVGNDMRVEDRDSAPCIKYREKEISLAVIKTKQLYSLVNDAVIIPTAFDRWQKEGLGQANWSNVIYLSYNCTKSTKLQAFQFQLMHRFIPTNKFLFVRGIVESPACRRCTSDDTIIHYFFACRTVRAFWGQVSQFINRNTYPTRYVLDLRSILFGICDAPSVVNLLLLLAKHYLYMCAGNGRMIRMEGYMGYVRSVHAAEMKAANGCVKKVANTECKWIAFVQDLKR